MAVRVRGEESGGVAPGASAASADYAVLFDMDGLLIDSEPLWLAAETEVSRLLGGPPWTAADQRALLGGSLDATVRYLMNRAPGHAVPPDRVAELLMDDITAQVRRNGVPLRPGAERLLHSVREAGVPHALVTSSERGFMEAVLASTTLRFDVRVCANDVTATKPDPEPYLRAAALLGLSPERCYAFEDSPNGVASAARAGCRVIAVPQLIPVRAAPGRTVIRSLEQVTVEPAGLAIGG